MSGVDESCHVCWRCKGQRVDIPAMVYGGWMLICLDCGDLVGYINFAA